MSGVLEDKSFHAKSKAVAAQAAQKAAALRAAEQQQSVLRKGTAKVASVLRWIPGASNILGEEPKKTEEVVVDSPTRTPAATNTSTAKKSGGQGIY